jgi:type I restriction enzyme M protein
MRRLDCVLADTKESCFAGRPSCAARGCKASTRSFASLSRFAFYNTSRHDFENLLGDALHLAANLRNCIAGFSPNMREVLEKFDFDNTISKLDEAGLLFEVLERFKNVDLHPDRIDNPTMGTVFEELIRKLHDALNENPGEHFTPRDVVHLTTAPSEKGSRTSSSTSTYALTGMRRSGSSEASRRRSSSSRR